MSGNHYDALIAAIAVWPWVALHSAHIPDEHGVRNRPASAKRRSAEGMSGRHRPGFTGTESQPGLLLPPRRPRPRPCPVRGRHLGTRRHLPAPRTSVQWLDDLLPDPSAVNRGSRRGVLRLRHHQSDVRRAASRTRSHPSASAETPDLQRMHATRSEGTGRVTAHAGPLPHLSD